MNYDTELSILIKSFSEKDNKARDFINHIAGSIIEQDLGDYLKSQGVKISDISFPYLFGEYKFSLENNSCFSIRNKSNITIEIVVAVDIEPDIINVRGVDLFTAYPFTILTININFIEEKVKLMNDAQKEYVYNGIQSKITKLDKFLYDLMESSKKYVDFENRYYRDITGVMNRKKYSNIADIISDAKIFVDKP